MHRLNISYLLLLVLALSLASCEDVVNLPNEDEPQLVVFSNFSDQNNLEVFVFKTKSVLSNKPTEFVLDAFVSVYADGELIEELQLVVPDSTLGLNPFYKTLNLAPVFDKEYSIEVKVDGYPTITATNSIPTPVNLEDASFEPQVSNGKGNIVVVNFSTSVSLRDPLGVENFYHLKFSQEFRPFSLAEIGDTLWGEPYTAHPNIMNKVDENSPPIKYNEDQSYLIKDTEFDGQYITLKFTGQYTFDASNTVPSEFLIELRTVSKAYYLYHESLNWQYQNGGPTGEGDVVFNNIDNGVGNFSGFTSKTNSFKLTD